MVIAVSKPKKQAAPVGRPTKYTEELVDEICLRISKGESLTSICESGLIGYATVCRWLAAEATFREKYAQAREEQADFYASQIVDIADELEVETIMQGGQVKFDVSSSAVARNRLRVDARKWYASKLAPKKYGDKLALGGADDLPAIKQDVNLSPSEAYDRMVRGK